MAKRKLCELRKELIDYKQMRAIMEDAIGAADARPKMYILENVNHHIKNI